MTTPVTATHPAASTTGTSAPDAMSQLSGNFITFLTLLTTQLKNQDPTSPMDSNTFTQQLVMYSQVEQQINTNTNLKTLISQGRPKRRLWPRPIWARRSRSPTARPRSPSGAATWNYNLGAAAATTQLTITDAKGKTVYTGAGETTAGDHAFTWNGKDNNGNQLADGTYKLTVDGGRQRRHQRHQLGRQRRQGQRRST